MEPIQRRVNINSIAISRLVIRAFFIYQRLLDENKIVLNLKLYIMTEK